jgi:hypothetical protein
MLGRNQLRDGTAVIMRNQIDDIDRALGISISAHMSFSLQP